MPVKRQASKRKALISIPKSKISKYTLAKVQTLMGKAEYEKVFTDATWTNLSNRQKQLEK